MNSVIISSSNKSINNAKMTGKLNLLPLALYQLVNEQLKFLNTVDKDYSLYITEKKQLRSLLNSLIYKYSNELCNYKISINVAGNTNDELDLSVSGTNINLNYNEEYQFSINDFNNNYNGNTISYVKLYLESVYGEYTLNGESLTGTVILTETEINNLVYTRINDISFNENLNFRILNNNQSTNLASNTIIGLAETINQPATIGDNTIYVDNRIETILTLDMFTSQLAPPYSDPENDLIDAIRIDLISDSNLGTFYLNGSEISEGTIITREQLSNNEFTHIGPNQDTISSDVFNFSARDEGSQIWVQ